MRRSKYGARRAYSPITGAGYPSTIQRDRAESLRLLERAGEIRDLREEVTIRLRKYVTYRLDAVYLEEGRMVYEDTKGVETERFRLLKNLWKEQGPGVLRIVRRSFAGGRWTFEEIRPEKIIALDKFGV